jgi:hypothetical protein
MDKWKRKAKYIKRKAWQRSIRHMKQRSHVRHAKYGYKGGK